MVSVSGFALLLAAILAYQLGRWTTSRVSVLNQYHIPAPVTGGLIVSILLGFYQYFSDLKIVWGFELRDHLLLIFFCTIGLNVRLRLLVSGGKTLSFLFFIIALFLILQNAVGILTTLAIGDEPIHGLLAGSISMAGGHGTAISWGYFLETEGYSDATQFGLVAATMGLIMGGLLGGPVARKLITDNNLDHTQADLNVGSTPETFETREVSFCMQQFLQVILVICLCIIVGKWLNQHLRDSGVVMPDYLPVLMLAIIIVNLSDLLNHQYNEQFINLFGDTCLEMFITMSLMSLNIAQLANAALPAFIIVLVQSVFICLFAYTVIFRAAGRDYDASLISAGFVGLGLGATPVGLANINTLTHKYGPSPKAFLIVPLLGSVFTDTLNAVILQAFLWLPIFHS